MRVLDTWLQSNQRATHTLTLLQTSAKARSHMIFRVTSKSGGMKERDTLRLVRSLVVSRITHRLPYYHLAQSVTKRANTL